MEDAATDDGTGEQGLAFYYLGLVPKNDPGAVFVSKVFYPKIRVADYYTLRSGPDMGLPETYHEWRDLQAREMREIILSGDTPVEVEVDPDEFAQYYHASQHARTFARLKQFVAEKGEGRSA